MTAYPSMLVLSPKEENIFRWSGYAETWAFMHQMGVALERYDLYRAGKEWDAPEPRPPHISSQAKCSLLASPVDDRLGGICFVDGALWSVYKQTLYKLDARTGKSLKSYPIQVDENFTDLGSDETFLYLLPFGYTAGKEIWTFNRKTEQWGPRIFTEEYKKEKVYSARGIAARGGSLYVASHLGIQKVDPATGKVQSTVKLELDGYRVFGNVGLDFVGDDLVCAATMDRIKLDEKGKPLENYTYGLDKERPRLNVLLWVNPATGKVRSFRLLHYPAYSVAFGGGTTYYLTELPVMGFDRQNKQVRVYPKKMAIHRLIYPK